MLTNELYVYGNQNVQIPAHLNFGKYMLDQLRKMNNEIAVENAETNDKLTYKEFTQYSVNLATSLMKLGVKRGDIVAVGSEKRNTFVPTVLAIVFTGATYTPYDLNSGRAVLRHKLSITQPKYFICSKLFWEMNSDVLQSFDCIKTCITLDDAPASAISVKSLISNDVDVNRFEPAEVDGENDTAFILYSSGTTGMPKGVCLSHLNCILNSLFDEYSDESLKTVFVFGEWYHNYDTFMTYKFLLAGRKVVYVNDPSQDTVLRCLQDCQLLLSDVVAIPGPFFTIQALLALYCIYLDKIVNIAMLVPSHVAYISKVENIGKYNLDSLRIIYSRSSPLHSKTVQRLKQMLPKLQDVLQGYGMTECGELTSENWGTKGPKSGSVGMASPGITLKISDPETDKTLGPNQHGEIRITGPVLMKGYIGVDPSTYLDPEGFFKTGDLGFYDDDKYFYIVDRIKEMISYDGYKIAPLELETILLLHPGVREAGVVGKPVPVYGEEPTAFVVKQPGSNVTEKELVQYVASEVAPLMQLIGGVKFIEKIPRNPRGKILRRALREMLSQFPE